MDNDLHDKIDMQAVELGIKTKRLSLFGNRFHPLDARMYSYVTIEYENPHLTFKAHFPQYNSDDHLPEVIEKRIDDLARLAITIRMRTPYASDEVEVMLDDTGGRGAQYPFSNTCSIDVFSADYLEIFAHEFGHVIFRRADSLAWRMTYLFSLGRRRFDIVRDSLYTNGWREDIKGPCRGIPDRSEPVNWDHPYAPGHPWANANELFASAFAAFILHPQMLADKIHAESTSKDMARFGTLMYLYLRDDVFLGWAPLGKDPLVDGRLDRTLAGLGVQEVVEALRSPHPRFLEIIDDSRRGDIRKIIDWLNNYYTINAAQLCNRIGWKNIPSFILTS